VSQGRVKEIHTESTNPGKGTTKAGKQSTGSEGEVNKNGTINGTYQQSTNNSSNGVNLIQRKTA